MEAIDQRCERSPLRRLRRAFAKDGGDFTSPALDLGCGISDARFVDGIVDSPAEVPDDANGFAFLSREDKKGVIEVGVARHQDFPSNVAAANAGRSRFPIVGRRCSVSYSSASTLSRMRDPPAHVARSS